jgi:hypothetical protein
MVRNKSDYFVQVFIFYITSLFSVLKIKNDYPLSSCNFLFLPIMACFNLSHSFNNTKENVDVNNINTTRKVQLNISGNEIPFGGSVHLRSPIFVVTFPEVPLLLKGMYVAYTTTVIIIHRMNSQVK